MLLQVLTFALVFVMTFNSWVCHCNTTSLMVRITFVDAAWRKLCMQLCIMVIYCTTMTMCSIIWQMHIVYTQDYTYLLLGVIVDACSLHNLSLTPLKNSVLFIYLLWCSHLFCTIWISWVSSHCSTTGCKSQWVATKLTKHDEPPIFMYNILVLEFILKYCLVFFQSQYAKYIYRLFHIE